MTRTLKSLGLAGMVFLLPLLVSVVYPTSDHVFSVNAAEKKEPKYKDVKTRKRASVGKTCAKALDRVRGEGQRQFQRGQRAGGAEREKLHDRTKSEGRD